MSFKQRIIAIVIAIGALLIVIFRFGLGAPSTPTLPPEPGTVKSIRVGDEIEIVSTKPEKLIEKQDLTILPTQVIEITFNKPLENAPETRIVLEPQPKFKVELSEDKKTVKIIPEKPFALGQGYTLFIKGETKFEGKKTLGQDVDFHFTTIAYSGV